VSFTLGTLKRSVCIIVLQGYKGMSNARRKTRVRIVSLPNVTWLLKLLIDQNLIIIIKFNGDFKNHITFGMTHSLPSRITLKELAIDSNSVDRYNVKGISENYAQKLHMSRQRVGLQMLHHPVRE
jgi:hypothetical protein